MHSSLSQDIIDNTCSQVIPDHGLSNQDVQIITSSDVGDEMNMTKRKKMLPYLTGYYLSLESYQNMYHNLILNGKIIVKM